MNLSPGRPSVPASRCSTITKPGPRAQRALGALVADDPVEALERLLGIREPVAVVGVRDVVVRGAASAGSTGRRCRARPRPGRCPTRRPTASRRAPAGRAPRTSRARARCCRRPPSRWSRAGRPRCRRSSASPSESAAIVLTHGTPWLRSMISSQLVDALGLVHLEEVVQVAEVAGVRVAHRPGGRRRPREQRQAEERRSGSSRGGVE